MQLNAGSFGCFKMRLSVEKYGDKVGIIGAVGLLCVGCYLVVC